MVNATLADIFEEMGLLLSLKGVAFKPRAYEQAAAEIRSLSTDLGAIYKQKGKAGLNAIPGIGIRLAEKIEEYLKTGHIREHQRLKKNFPVDIRGLTAIEGVGPQTVKLLYRRLKIKTVADLTRALKQGKVAKLPGLGVKSAAKIAQGLEFLKTAGDRQLLGPALSFARRLEKRLLAVPGVTHAVTCGSLRRRQETVGDFDILVTTSKPRLVNQAFVSLPEVVAVHSQGPTRSSVRLSSGLDADLRVVPTSAFGAALQYFTGDKSHNVAIRKIASSRGYKLNEYGLWQGQQPVSAATEASIYKKLGLDYIEPELRTNTGEIEAARAHALPPLISYHSLRGDLQVHSTDSDGSASIAAMAAAALTLSYEYIAITDHTKSLAMAGGLDEHGLLRQAQIINRLNANWKKRRRRFTILKSAEVNILKDGSLDIADSALAKLDLVGAAIHSHFNLSRKEMTARLLRAISHPRVHIIFHPTGRLLNRRPAYDFDFDAVARAAAANHVALEIDATPARLDLKDELARRAVALGAKLVINSDAHHPDHFAFTEFGLATARRAWVKKGDVLNTQPLSKLLTYFKKKK